MVHRVNWWIRQSQGVYVAATEHTLSSNLTVESALCLNTLRHNFHVITTQQTIKGEQKMYAHSYPTIHIHPLNKSL